jgi:hypothetical protein
MQYVSLLNKLEKGGNDFLCLFYPLGSLSTSFFTDKSVYKLAYAIL